MELGKRARGRRKGASCVCPSVSSKWREIARRVAHRMPAGASAGGLWSGIKKIARKVAKARVLRKVATAWRAVASNPAVAQAVGLTAQAFGVPAPLARSILAGTTKLSPAMLAAGAATGSLVPMAQIAALQTPSGQKALAGAIVKAKAGDPDAQAVVKVAARAARRVKVAAAAARLITEAAARRDPRACAALAQAKRTIAAMDAERARRCGPAGGASAGGPFALPRSSADVAGYGRSRVSFAPIRGVSGRY